MDNFEMTIEMFNNRFYIAQKEMTDLLDEVDFLASIADDFEKMDDVNEDKWDNVKGHLALAAEKIDLALDEMDFADKYIEGIL